MQSVTLSWSFEVNESTIDGSERISGMETLLQAKQEIELVPMHGWVGKIDVCYLYQQKESTITEIFKGNQGFIFLKKKSPLR